MKMTSIPYFHDAHEYLEWKLQQGDSKEGFLLLSRLTDKLKGSDIEDVLREEMKEDGFFDQGD